MKEETPMAVSIMDKVAEAKSIVPAISPKDAQTMIGRSDVLFVDVRDAPELSDTGKIKDALQVSRGMLEFRADDKTPYHNGAFTRDKAIVLYCASGGRSALAGKALMEMGYTKVFNLGAFKDWVEAGGPVEQV